ncbi:hypothetical protein Nepgr_015249 [Nepenthes gracilis]|uniref:Uncharacterized protein n=1 Tax=Nepenthes gracilis TaxID=150966 RepID=A0AAD3XQK0_NEPGR|nr:hypothetical protein Nepgr_015249 [Nepenthes gracilis]
MTLSSNIIKYGSNHLYCYHEYLRFPYMQTFSCVCVCVCLQNFYQSCCQIYLEDWTSGALNPESSSSVDNVSLFKRLMR